MKYLMIYFVLLLTLASCKKEENQTQPELPPETTTGANTAGFVVDGKKVILPSDHYSTVPGNGTLYGLSVQTGQNRNNSTRFFTIEIANIGAKQVYSARIRMPEPPLKSKIYDFGRVQGDFAGDGPNYAQMMVIVSGKDIETEWYYSNFNNGSITFIKSDATQKIYSGTFEATLYGRFDSNKTMQISQGRFDIKL